MTRLLLMSVGHLCVGLAVLGVFLPGLPTTPFVLAASACYMRSSTRFHQMLHHSRLFGPVLRDWERDRSISKRAKCTAILTMVIFMSITMLFVSMEVRYILAAIGVGVSIFILTRRTAPEQH